MKVKLKLFLKKTLRAGMTLDRHLLRLLGGHKHFKPQALNLEYAKQEDYLKIISLSDKVSFKRFKQASGRPFLARGYLVIRNNLFILAYRAGKRVLR